MFLEQKSAELSIQEQDVIDMSERRERLLAEISQLKVNIKFIKIFQLFCINFFNLQRWN